MWGKGGVKREMKQKLGIISSVIIAALTPEWLTHTHTPWHVKWETSKTVNTRKVRTLDSNGWYSQADSSWHI